MAVAATASALSTAPREVLYEWWTDYSDRDHPDAHFPKTEIERRIVWREPGKGCELVDEGRVMGLPLHSRSIIELTPPERVHARADTNRGKLEVDYWFEGLPGGGTRLTARALLLEPRAESRAAQALAMGRRIVAPITASALHGLLVFDLRAHLAEFEADRRRG